MSDNSPPEVLPGSNVRLRRTSLILYVLNLGGAAFSFFFITLLARKLTLEDYATWIMILRYIGYVVIPSVVFTYWLTRDISRGKNTSRSGLNLSVYMGMATMPVYLALIYLFSTGFKQPILPLALSSIALFMDYITNALSATSNGYNPEINGYAGFIMKAGQAISGFILLGLLTSGLVGAIIAMIIGKFLMNLAFLVLNRRIIRESKFDMGIIRSWIRASWLPFFVTLAGVIFTLDVLVVNLIYSNAVPIAYYGIAISVIGVVTYATVVSTSFYPKVLCKRNLEDLGDAVWLTSLLSIPTVGIIIMYAYPVAAIFGVKYLPATLGLQTISIATIIQMLYILASTSYIGLEGSDQESLSSRSLFKSAIFKNGAVICGTNVAYIIALSAVSSLGLEPSTFVAIWGILLVATYLSSFLMLRHLIRADFGQSFSIKMVLRNFFLFAVPLVPAVAPYFLIGVEISEAFYQMFMNLVVPVMMSFAIYFGVLYLIDRKFRVLAKDIWKKFFSRNGN